MDFRADKKQITDYILGKSEEIYKEILQDNPDFKPSIELTTSNNLKILRHELRALVEDFNSDDDVILDIDTDASQGRRYCSQYIPVPVDISELYNFSARERARQENKRYLESVTPSYPQFKKLLRNMLLHNVSNCSSSACSYDDRQVESPYLLKGHITIEDNKLSATVHMCTQKDGGFFMDNGWSDAVEVYKIQPLRLSKFLKKLEISDKFITKVMTKISNVPKTVTLCFTDKYIPECYIGMSSKVSSCMSYGSSGYGLPDDEHPTLAYEGSPDVLLALVKDETSDADFPFINRAIILREDWGYNTCYGNELLHSLKLFGIGRTDSINGIRLSLIESGNGGILAPYVDGSDCRFTKDDGYLCVDYNGDFQSDYGTGRLGGEYYCEWCDSNVDELEDIHDGGGACPGCIEECFVYVDDRGYVLRDNTTLGENSAGDEIRIADEDAQYSEYYGTYLHEEYSYWSDKCNSWLHDSDNEDDIFSEMHGCHICNRCGECGKDEEGDDEC